MPVRDPAATVAEISAAAVGPPAGRYRPPALFFRYTLRWDKPPVTAPPQGPASSATR